MPMRATTWRVAPERPSVRPGIRLGETTYAYALLAPAVAVVLFLVVYPLVRTVELSLRQGRSMNLARISELPLGLENYQRVLADPAFWNSLQVSFVYVSTSVAFAFVLGLGSALLLNQSFPGRRLFRALFLLPWAVPGVIVSIIFLWMFDSSFGVVNAMLRQLGLIASDVTWFVDRRTALWAVMMPTVWKAYPLIALTLLAAMQSIPQELYEAADMDGASRMQRFTYITWPALQATAMLSVLISALWIFRDVDIIFASTHGGPARATETLSVYTYNEAFQYFRMGTGAAVGTLMVAIALAGTALSVVLVGRDRF